jgi:hypothetical protein
MNAGVKYILVQLRFLNSFDRNMGHASWSSVQQYLLLSKLSSGINDNDAAHKFLKLF